MDNILALVSFHIYLSWFKMNLYPLYAELDITEGILFYDFNDGRRGVGNGREKLEDWDCSLDCV